MCDFQCGLLQVSAMTKDTQDIMARAQEQSNTADAQAAELQRVRMLQVHHGTAQEHLVAARACCVARQAICRWYLMFLNLPNM
jgi:hypothetical protein